MFGARTLMFGFLGSKLQLVLGWGLKMISLLFYFFKKKIRSPPGEILKNNSS